MYAGHFAIGLAIGARHPRLPAAPIMLGVVFFDLLSALATMAGIEALGARLDDGVYLFLSTTVVDGFHSFVAAFVWAAAWGLLFLRHRPLARIAALAAFSHFLVDWPFHYADLPIHPHRTPHLALGVGQGFGTLQWLLEGGVVALALAYAGWRSRGTGVHPLAAIGVLLGFAAMYPQLPWMQALGELRVSHPGFRDGLLALSGYAGMALLLSGLLYRDQRRADPAWPVP